MSARKITHPKLTRTDLPTFERSLTKKHLDELFAWCAAEYQRRYARNWRFKDGFIRGGNGGKFRIFYRNQWGALGSVLCLNRYWLETTLLSVLNEAGDLEMTLR